MNKEVIKITGITCAVCVKRIENAVKRLPGIFNASVNIATEKLAVEYDERKTSIKHIKNVIIKAGYGILDDEDRLQEWKKIRELQIKLIISAIFAIPLLYIAMVPMISWLTLPFPSSLEPMKYPLIYALTELILTIPIVIAGYKFYIVGFKALIQLSPNMDSLIAIGTSAAVLYSIYSIWQISTGIFSAADNLYFETAGIIITLILMGKYLEAIAKGKTSEAIKELMGLAPKTAVIIRDGKEVEIPVDEVGIGDVVKIVPGDKIPVDGVVLSGHTTIDESMLTGESIPVDKAQGDSIYAATVNKNGTIQFRATKIGKDTALAQIIRLVEDAQGSKAPIAKMADIVSGYFVPIVCVIALISGIAWYIATRDIEFSLTIFISVLVIACPCALGLATPTAIMVGTGKGAEYGILIKGGEALETTHKINMIVFDKTGTITEGKPRVTDIITVNNIERNRLLQLVASAEKASEHPLSEAVVKYAEEENLEFLKVDNFEAIPGHGIEAEVLGINLLVGNQKLMADKNISLNELKKESDRLSDEGKTSMYIAIDNKISGIIAVADIVRENSVNSIQKLHKLGIEVTMITGDNKKTADAIAKQVGIDNVLAEVLPQDKSNEVKKLQVQGKKVAMVGDGINDAPALAQADIGIAIGSGTDVAIESADIILMRNDLMDVSTAIHLSRSTIRNIKQNLFWAFGYNTAGIPIAAGLLYIFGGPLLNPIFAALAMSLSSVSVLTNALRLKRFRPYK